MESERYRPELEELELGPAERQPEAGQGVEHPNEDENDSPATDPEWESEQEPAIDLSAMSIEIAVMLMDAITAAHIAAKNTEDRYKFTPLELAFSEGLKRLPTQNIEHARALIIAMANSESDITRAEAADAMEHLLRREHELDPNGEHVGKLVDLWIGLERDRNNDSARQAAWHAMGRTVDRGWLRPDLERHIRRHVDLA